MKKLIIVGGGLSGLLAAKHAKRLGLEVYGFESQSVLGGLSLYGGHRILCENSLLSLSNVVSVGEWEPRQQRIGEFRKGELIESSGAPKDKDDEQEGSRATLVGDYFLNPSYLWSNVGISGWVQQLREEVGELYRCRRTVSTVDHLKREVVTVEGEAASYDGLVWSAPLSQLARAYHGPSLSQTLLSRRKKADYWTGGFVFEQFLSEPLSLPFTTLILKFRLKEDRLVAFGLIDLEPQIKIQWVVPLPAEILENREELAKAVRSFKREFEKQTASASPKVVRERIVHCPLLGAEPMNLQTPGKLTEGLWYFGPALTGGSASSETYRRADSVANYYSEFCSSIEEWIGNAPLSLPTLQQSMNVNENHSIL